MADYLLDDLLPTPTTIWWQYDLDDDSPLYNEGEDRTHVISALVARCRSAEATLEAKDGEVERLRERLGLLATYDKNVTDDRGRSIPGRPAIHPAMRAIAAAALAPSTPKEGDK